MNPHRIASTTEYASGLRDLVKGQEQALIEEMKPLVHSHSVRLDLSGIQRIDAAGLAALVLLHCEALQAGHEFSVGNASSQVTRILTLVGLNRILLSKDLEEMRAPAPQPNLAAA